MSEKWVTKMPWDCYHGWCAEAYKSIPPKCPICGAPPKTTTNLISKVPDTVEYWLSRCRAVTEAHIKKHGSIWSLNDQIAHAHSEVAEVYQAVRHGESSERVLEEICDSIYSALTMAHIAGFTDSEVMDELETVLRKIEGRVGGPILTAPGPDAAWFERQTLVYNPQSLLSRTARDLIKKRRRRNGSTSK